MAAAPTSPAPVGPVQPTSPATARAAPTPSSPAFSLNPAANHPDPQPDLVLIFKTTLSGKDKAKRAQAASALASEYEGLIRVLEWAGLEATGRSGGHNSGTVLILVKAGEERVRKESRQEQESDFVFDVSCGTADPRDFDGQPITPAERTRLVHRIVTSATTDPSLPSCGLALPSPDYPHLASIFAPQLPAFNARWLASWTHSPTSLKGLLGAIPDGSLTDIRNHLGEKTANYFAFLRFYYFALAAPALVGFVFWALRLFYAPVYAAFISLWALVFVESWRIKERKLAVQWGVHNVHEVEVVRPGFVPSEFVLDPATGRQVGIYPAWKTILRAALSVPVLLAWTAGLAGLISVTYAIEVVVNESYDGPGKMYLGLLPTILFAGVVPQIAALWHKVAERLTQFENHMHPSDHAKSVALKSFAVTALVAYGPLLLTSYVYIPFGPSLVPWLLAALPDSVHTHTLRAHSTFAVNGEKLHHQVLAFTLTGQISGAVVEMGLPFLLDRGKGEVAKVLEKRNGGPKERDAEDEHHFLERIRHEATLPEYAVFADYSEMATQFGYAALFSVVWPIAPVWSFVNNFFELRGDAFKLTAQSRRPIPVREASIGPWLSVLSFIAYFSAIIPPSVVYLYHPSSTCLAPCVPSAPVVDAGSLLANGTALIKSFLPEAVGGTPGPKAVLGKALLVALTAEHVFLAVRWGVRFVLNQVVWVGSAEERQVRVARLGRKMAGVQGKVGGAEGVQAAVAKVQGEAEKPGLTDEKDGSGDEIGAARVEAAVLQARATKEVEEGAGKGTGAVASSAAVVPLDGFWSRPDKGLYAIQKLNKTE